jgi:hypothetical protein
MRAAASLRLFAARDRTSHDRERRAVARLSCVKRRHRLRELSCHRAARSNRLNRSADYKCGNLFSGYVAATDLVQRVIAEFRLPLSYFRSRFGLLRGFEIERP